MNMKSILAASLFALILVSCNTAKTNNETIVPDMHTSEISLDWAGTYSGSLPCSSCAELETELTLNSDNTYVLTQRDFSREKESKITEGKFTWKENIIVLENMPKEFDSNSFKVEEGRIRMLDKAGNKITGDSENNYLLSKNGNSEVENKKWMLVKLYGKNVKGTAETHYLIFHEENNQIEAKAACNQLTFGYKIKNGLRLEITPGISTMMACPDEVEETFKKMMLEIDNFSVTEKTLTLNKARMAPLAVFELVD